MALNYTVKVTDRLLRFDTTGGDVTVTLLPFADTPNAPYEIHRISTGDGHTVTIQTDPTTPDFLLPDGTASLTLDDDTYTVYIKIPVQGQSPAYVSWGSGGGGGGGGGGGSALPAPDVIIDPVHELIFRSDHRVEIDIAWAKASTANVRNFAGVEVFLEDPDISSGANGDMDGAAVSLDGSAQVSGQQAPISVNKCVASPAVVFLDSTMGTVNGQTYRTERDVRIYLASYGPSTQSHLQRATDPSPSPNVVITVPVGPGKGKSGIEYAFLATNVNVTVTEDYNRTDPQYYLTFFYEPPDPSVPVPPGMNRFGGCRIVFVYEDATGAPIWGSDCETTGGCPADTGINVPVAQASIGYRSPAYKPGAGGGKYRVYFCSEDDAQPLGVHINTLVEGVTPYKEITVTAVPPVASVTGFTISNQKVVWMLDGSFYAQASFSWSLPTDIRYTGVFLYLVKVTGATPPLTAFPKRLTAQQSRTDKDFVIQIPDIPANPEVWTIAAISVDNNGVLADDPAKFGTPGFTSPTVTWNIGPPTPGSPGSGLEFAPPVNVTGATASASDSMSADGVGMVSFSVGPWTNPTDNKFGSAQVAMVVNHDPTTPTFWSVPANATSFITPTMPSFGHIGAHVPVDFYILSDDPQGNKNGLVPGTTPVVHLDYVPSEGKIIPARDGWFSSEFSWGTGGFQADSFAAKKVLVGNQLIVGGAPSSFSGSSKGTQNGQIAVFNGDPTPKLVAWMGQSEPGLGQGQGPAGVYGGWFGQLYIGGTNPLDAPVFVDNDGVVEVGGIAAAQSSSKYPYISVRDDHGREMGRIGAKLTVPSGTSGDNVGPSPPPQLTAGAWFTQLGIGGSSISNWNVLIVPDPNNPLGSQFKIRNVYNFTIDYPAIFGSGGAPSMQHYIMEFGSSVWMAAGLSGGWNFPGIHLYEVDGAGNNFGGTFLNRGMVLRGTQTMGHGTSNPVPYPVLVSLVTYNGSSSGSDAPDVFWGEFSMYGPVLSTGNRYERTVALTSGSQFNGSASFWLGDKEAATLFNVDTGGNVFVKGTLQGVLTSGGTQQPVTALALNIQGYGPVIDSSGNWKGKAITGSQSPWTQNITGAGFNLTGAGDIGAARYFITGISKEVINTAGQFVGKGADTRPDGIFCGSLDTVNTAATASGYIKGGTITAREHFDTVDGYWVGGVKKCGSDGVWLGSVQTNDHVYGADFGIINSSGPNYLGWPGGKPSGTFITGNLGVIYIGSLPNRVEIYVCGGIIVNVIGPGY